MGVVAVSHGCPSLEMINIAYNERITDTSLISLSECLRLKVLEIRGCPRITAIGLSAIAMGCRQLAMLDIKKCFNINDNGMIPLAQYSQNLKQVISSSVQFILMHWTMIPNLQQWFIPFTADKFIVLFGNRCRPHSTS